MPVLQELERSSCGGGVVLPAVPFLRARRTEGVFLIQDDLLIHAHCGTFFRQHSTVARPEVSKAGRPHKDGDNSPIRLGTFARPSEGFDGRHTNLVEIQIHQIANCREL